MRSCWWKAIFFLHFIWTYKQKDRRRTNKGDKMSIIIYIKTDIKWTYQLRKRDRILKGKWPNEKMSNFKNIWIEKKILQEKKISRFPEHLKCQLMRLTQYSIGLNKLIIIGVIFEWPSIQPTNKSSSPFFKPIHHQSIYLSIHLNHHIVVDLRCI